MKKFLCFTSGILFCLLSQAQQPGQQPQQQQQIIINNPASDSTKKNTPPAATVQAESKSEGGVFMLGFRYMPTISTFDIHTTQGVAEGSFVVSNGGGGFIGVKTSEHCSLQLEVIYLKLAQKFEQGNSSNKVELSYINVPLMLVLNSDFRKPVNFNAAVGPQVGFNTGSSLTVESGSEADTLHAVLAVKPADIGIAYGVGLDFGGGNIKFAVGFRGVYGLVDISDKSNNITTDQYYVLDRSHVKTYSAYIGLTFVF